MLEPQSTVLFVLLVIGFGALVWWLVVARHLAVRIVAAALSFAVAMSFGILSVNKYFGYYATWGAAVADFDNQAGPTSGPAVAQGNLLVGEHSQAGGQNPVYLRLALQNGYTMRVTVAGKLSHITRQAYVYLPPQYFESRYADYRFPVVELIHGQPGDPQDWINVVGVQVTLDNLIREGLAQPAVLVMPDADGSNHVSLQCLNQVGGPRDLTYLAQDVPDKIASMLRVQPPGYAWGIAGYSEGGFCAANIALHFRYRYGFAASMSGYFAPLKNELADGRFVNPFGGNATLQKENTPVDEVQAVAPGAVLPQFWLGAGQDDRQDVRNAEYFAQELQLHQANVPLDITPDGGHTMTTWHAEVPPMLSWITNGLASAVAQHAAKARALARHRRQATAAPHRPSAPPSPSAPATPRFSSRRASWLPRTPKRGGDRQCPPMADSRQPIPRR